MTRVAAQLASSDRFDVAILTDLPDAARRWLAHAIAPGTPLLHTARIRQYGRIKAGWWQSFNAAWLLSPPDHYVWRVETHRGPVRIRGFDRCVDDRGEMDWRLFGRIPILRASGMDVTRSGLGRIAAETCFVPAAALCADWHGVDHHRAVARIVTHHHAHDVLFTVAEDGRLTRVDVHRWGNPAGGDFGLHLFTAELDGPEITSGGYTVPATARAGWWHCPDACAAEAFIDFTIDRISYC